MHVFYHPSAETFLELPQEEAVHAIKVLRLQPGDDITLTDGKGYFYQARITSADRKHCTYTIISKTMQPPYWKGYLHIAIAPTKNMDRMEWMAEKATEIGIDELSFLNCRYSERKTIKPERIEKIQIAAIKQSLKARLPKLNDMEDFKTFVTTPREGQKFIAHCYEGEKPFLCDVVQADGNAMVLIGPEGDFSEEEVQLAIQHGYQPVSLGLSRLRTETAALVALHIMNLKHS